MRLQGQGYRTRADSFLRGAFPLTHLSLPSECKSYVYDVYYLPANDRKEIELELIQGEPLREIASNPSLLLTRLTVEATAGTS